MIILCQYLWQDVKETAWAMSWQCPRDVVMTSMEEIIRIFHVACPHKITQITYFWPMLKCCIDISLTTCLWATLNIYIMLWCYSDFPQLYRICIRSGKIYQQAQVMCYIIRAHYMVITIFLKAKMNNVPPYYISVPDILHLPSIITDPPQLLVTTPIYIWILSTRVRFQAMGPYFLVKLSDQTISPFVSYYT